MLDTIKGNEGYQQMFSKLAGTQGLSDFNEKSFLANPQSYINRGSVEQQAYLQNLLYGTEMSYGDVDIDEEDTGLMQNPRMATFGF
jgi:hypothetical protein